ncbi:MAG TPA: hypothetical protein VGG64_30205 [Pirellulales bacterium]|jgi:hypothetical protein
MQKRHAVIGLLLLASAGSSVLAAPPWNKLDLFHRLEADPDKSYPLAERNGPWMIMAMTFSGPNAEEQSRELVYELRSRFKLAAYTKEMHFDHTTDKNGKQTGAAARRVRYRLNEMTEIAVLVGDFPSIDDNAAQKTLDKIKLMQPDCLDLEKRAKEGKPDSRTLGQLRMIQQAVLPNSSARKGRGPMRQAFITTNPLLPDEYFAPKGIDRLVLDMNQPVKFSLLDCPGKYTVKVATFTGRVVIDQKQIEEIEKKGKPFDSQLALAAEKAHKLTMALRQKNYQAYEFHDRYASIVTIGSFNSVGTPRADGKIEINPEAHAIMETFGADKKVVPGQVAAQLGNPKLEAGIPLDIQPMLVEVPKRSISAQYERPTLTSRF